MLSDGGREAPIKSLGNILKDYYTHNNTVLDRALGIIEHAVSRESGNGDEQELLQAFATIQTQSHGTRFPS